MWVPTWVIILCAGLPVLWRLDSWFDESLDSGRLGKAIDRIVGFFIR